MEEDQVERVLRRNTESRSQCSSNKVSKKSQKQDVSIDQLLAENDRQMEKSHKSNHSKSGGASAAINKSASFEANKSG